MKSLCVAHERGLYAEQRVRDYFLKRGFRIWHHRKKIFGVEFDWVFQGREGLVYVEVKSVKSSAFFIQRWPKKQKDRFLKVASVLAESGPEARQFYLALVDYSDQIHLFRAGDEWS